MASYFDENTPDVVLRSLFSKYDADDSGIIENKEARTLLVEDLGMSNEEAEAAILLNDQDGSGSLAFNEFKAWLNKGDGLKNFNDASRYSILSKAVDMFRGYDLNGNGSLDRTEFCRLLNDIGHNDNEDAALAALDSDKNNKISFPEFLRWLNWIPM